MTPAHVDALMPYERELFGVEAWPASGYRAELRDADTRRYLAAEDDEGALLGWGGILTASDSAEILTIGIVPHAQRNGLGTELLHALLDAARERGAVEMFLEVRVDNAAARTMYEKDGFVEVGRRRGYYDHGRVDAVVMRREL